MSLRDLKKQFLVTTATDLFLARGIEEVTIEDIAKKAEVGEMTIYRYFGKKQSIVNEVVINLQQSVSTEFFKLDGGHTGFDKLSIFYNTYLEVFKKKPEYFRFIREFDLLMMKEDDKNLKEYEDGLAYFKNVYFDAYELGLKDGSVKEVKDLELFYYTSTHALIELCKKLSYDKSVLLQDEKISKVAELECLIHSFLSLVKNS